MNSQAITMWISVLVHQLTEGFRFPGNRVTVKTDDVNEGFDWGARVEDDVFTISNAIDHVDAENITDSKNYSFNFVPSIKEKRSNGRFCSCPSKAERVDLDDGTDTETFPSHFFGKVCDESRKKDYCKCNVVYHDMLVLKRKVSHNQPVHRGGPLHDSIKNDFYWDIKVSGKGTWWVKLVTLTTMCVDCCLVLF